MRRFIVTGVLLGLLAPAAVGAAPPGKTAPKLPELKADVSRSRAEQLRLAKEYKATLERLLSLREADLQRATESLERTRDLVDRGIVARNDLQAAERAVLQARVRVDETWNEALVAASLIAKALAQEEMAGAPVLRPGGEQITTSLVRYRGTRPWTMALTRTIEDFFSRAFGRALPVSAYGQTRVHDKLGFDHRNAVDVAVHPDSAEGQALMGWLRQAGLSFIAFRGPVAGAATGAHIHVGEPSQRLASPNP